ncbi:MAG: FAD-binding oxidoreductase, partial [Gammaproteobacteria bacterium]
MSIQLPAKASAVVIGGGVTGSSVAYHLAKLGWTDVVQLERKQFSCGTTWHAAGLIGTMRANENHAKLAEYSMSILGQLEQETGQSTGFRQVGSLSIAHSEARFEELKRVASMNNAFGVTQVDMLTPADIKKIYPLLETDDLLGGSWVPHDGYASPVDVTMAFVKGARKHGAQCIEGVTVTDVVVKDGRVHGVTTDHGDIETDYIVNCAGMWARNLGKQS